MTPPVQSSGHEWRGTCFSQGGRFGNCECGDRKAQYITYAQHQAHLAHVAASVAHAAQPQEVPAPYFANGVPVDPMQPLTCDDMREITDACVHSDGSLTRDYRMMAVMANARAKAWLLGQTKPAPQEVPAEQPPCRICGAWLCSHLDDAPEPASAAKPPADSPMTLYTRF